MGKFLDAFRRNVWTRALPKSPKARLNFLMKREKGSTRAVAERLGVSQRTVQRYVSGERTPAPAVAKRLEAEAARDWQPRVRARAQAQAQTRGVYVETRARFGFTAAPGSTDDPRMRQVTKQMPDHLVGDMWRAWESGDEEGLKQVIGEGLGEAYFRDGNRRAEGLDVEITDVDYIDVDCGG